MKDGGPAFPQTDYFDEKPVGNTGGMTLRDWFATHAPRPDATVFRNWVNNDQRDAIYRAATEHAYQWADAMLAARKKEA
jgi:hypothetical protein